MKPEQQEALRLRESGLSRSAIAAQMGKTERQVKRLLERARKWQEAPSALRDGAAAIGADTAANIVWTKTDKDGNVTYSVQHSAKRGETTENLLERVAEAFENIPAYEPKPVEFDHSDLLTVYGLFDVHAGQLSWGRETRGPDYDLELFRSDVTNSVDRLSSRVPKSGHALVVLGGDTLHTPNGNNETPGHGHKLDVDGRFEKVVDVSVDALSQAIEILSDKHAKVSVVVVRGNHCEESHLILKMALKQRYRNVDRIDFPVVNGADKSEIFWMQHGKNLIAVHHGDKAKPEKLAMIVADKCGFWDKCTASRVILTGHVHHLRTLDLVGCTHYSLRAFAPPDSYGANFGGVRGLQAMTFDPKYGMISQTHDGIWRDDE